MRGRTHLQKCQSLPSITSVGVLVGVWAPCSLDKAGFTRIFVPVMVSCQGSSSVRKQPTLERNIPPRGHCFDKSLGAYRSIGQGSNSMMAWVFCWIHTAADEHGKHFDN